MEPLNNQINNLITAAKAMRSHPKASKKAINKTIARLEEAQLWARQIFTEPLPEPRGEIIEHPNHNYQKCTCPAGAVDNSCPIHGNN